MFQAILSQHMGRVRIFILQLFYPFVARLFSFILYLPHIQLWRFDSNFLKDSAVAAGGKYSFLVQSFFNAGAIKLTKKTKATPGNSMYVYFTFILHLSNRPCVSYVIQDCPTNSCWCQLRSGQNHTVSSPQKICKVCLSKRIKVQQSAIVFTFFLSF